MGVVQMTYDARASATPCREQSVTLRCPDVEDPESGNHRRSRRMVEDAPVSREHDLIRGGGDEGDVCERPTLPRPRVVGSQREGFVDEYEHRSVRGDPNAVTERHPLDPR